MFISTDQLIDLGISREELKSKIATGEWKTHKNISRDYEITEAEILLSSLPENLQLKLAQNNPPPDYPEKIKILLSEASEYGINEQETEIVRLLLPLTVEERNAWITESLRLAHIIERFDKIHPKRQRSTHTHALEFVPGVLELCREATCKNSIILARHPHRARELSPHTLDDLGRAFNRQGLVVLLPKIKKTVKGKKDKRHANISENAVIWLNKTWQQFSGPYHLCNALKQEAEKNEWIIPSDSWVYRQWSKIPEMVLTYFCDGPQAYESKYASYLPRDCSDLLALQILCGDHSERDVMVLLPDKKTIARPWLTIWYDLRTGLIWGWYLALVPSSITAGLAYADGVRNFGAQPLSRPKDGFYSYIYTDNGRDYKSHNWDGREITVHKEAMKIEGGLEMILTQRRVGILDELMIKHLLPKGRNPKERPVERVFKDISDWEQNKFAEYCGRSPKSRPERFKELYNEHHQLYLKGKRASSPFMTLDQYREALAEFITRYNRTTHERSNLGSARVVPLDEYERLYSTRYEIAAATLDLLLMKAEKRVIRKNGVQCFQKHWFYLNEAMCRYKGKSVEIRYSDDDYSRVTVILPNLQLCEAYLITPTSLLNPNKQTLETVRKARATDRRIIREYDLIAQSYLRGETTEDRIARELEAEKLISIEDEIQENAQATLGKVHQLTRLDYLKPVIASEPEITTESVKEATTDISIFTTQEYFNIKEFDYDE